MGSMAVPFVTEIVHAFLGGKSDADLDRVLAAIAGVIDGLRPDTRIAAAEFDHIAASAAAAVEAFLGVRGGGDPLHRPDLRDGDDRGVQVDAGPAPVRIDPPTEAGH